MAPKQVLAEIELLHAHVQEMAQAVNGQIAAGGERLAKAIEREEGYKKEIAALKSENAGLANKAADLQRTIDAMHDHPDVKAKRRAEAEAALKAAQDRLAKLTTESE